MGTEKKCKNCYWFDRYGFIPVSATCEFHNMSFPVKSEDDCHLKLDDRPVFREKKNE